MTIIKYLNEQGEEFNSRKAYTYKDNDGKNVTLINAKTNEAKALVGFFPKEIEIPDPVPTDPREEYERLVAQYIREEYTLEHELALHRQRDTKVQEWNIYNTFCEECKRRAKEVVGFDSEVTEQGLETKEQSEGSTEQGVEA